MTEQWVPAYSRLFDPGHQMADEPACKRWAWLDLCYLTQRKDGTRLIDYKPVRVKRGELIASERFLAERWQWSRGKVQRFLTYLEHPDVHRIEVVRRTRAGTIYRLPTFEDYALSSQETAKNADPPIEPPSDPLVNGANRSNGHDIHDHETASRSTDGSSDGSSVDPLTGPNKRRIRGESSITRGVPNAVADFFDRVGAEWALKQPLPDWANGLVSSYPRVDLVHEILRCGDWHEEKGRTPKSPTGALHNWLKKAEADAMARPRPSSGQPYARAPRPSEAA